MAYRVVTNADQVSGEIAAFRKKHPKLFAEQAWKWGHGVRTSLVRPEPAPPPNSTYKRTGRLPISWSVKRGMGGRIEIVNSTDYAQWVVGRDTQARIHRGRWYIAEDEVEQQVPQLIRMCEREYQAQW